MSEMKFNTIQEFQSLIAAPIAENAAIRTAAQERNNQLTKPPGALGRLEDIAIWYAAWTGEVAPKIVAPQIVIFAGNHGVVTQGVSAFPQEVTSQMVANFRSGGAAINQLASEAGASLDVIELQLDKPTQDFTVGPAMETGELVDALQIGWDAVSSTSDLLVVGEMGIGNTTSAAAIAHALFGGDAADWTGPGTGLDSDGIAHKAKVVAQGVAKHGSNEPLEILQRLGGREIAAMVGAMAAARDARIPVVLDGFIASSAAAVLFKIDATLLDHVISGHLSEEAAHGKLLDQMALKPLLDLGLRLGEGSGAALAIQIVKAAVACHSGMATFAEAGVSEG